MVGKSICGKVETGNKLTATNPARTNPTVNSVVAIGL